MSATPKVPVTPEELEAKRLELMERQIALQESQAASLAVQVERTAPKENPNYVASGTGIKPDGSFWSSGLATEIYFGPVKLNGTVMREDEVAAWNRVRPLERARMTKTDGSVVYGSVDAERNGDGKITKLWVRFPFQKDSNPQHFPLCKDVALQLAAQAEQAA